MVVAALAPKVVMPTGCWASSAAPGDGAAAPLAQSREAAGDAAAFAPVASDRESVRSWRRASLIARVLALRGDATRRRSVAAAVDRSRGRIDRLQRAHADSGEQPSLFVSDHFGVLVTLLPREQ